jgi:hypothetical protein
MIGVREANLPPVPDEENLADDAGLPDGDRARSCLRQSKRNAVADMPISSPKRPLDGSTWAKNHR